MSGSAGPLAGRRGENLEWMLARAKKERLFAAKRLRGAKLLCDGSGAFGSAFENSDVTVRAEFIIRLGLIRCRCSSEFGYIAKATLELEIKGRKSHDVVAVSSGELVGSCPAKSSLTSGVGLSAGVSVSGRSFASMWVRLSKSDPSVS